MSAGEYEALMITGHRLVAQRAWFCAACDVRWYDGLDCPRCHSHGVPEPLPAGTKIIKEPPPVGANRTEA